MDGPVHRMDYVPTGSGPGCDRFTRSAIHRADTEQLANSPVLRRNMVVQKA